MSQHGSERRPLPPRESTGRARVDASRKRRLAAGAALAAAVLVTASGCADNAFTRLGMPEPASKEAPSILHLWQGQWITAFAVGALVWGLILWCCFAYRRKRHGIEVPPQTRYNMPLELLYTGIPLIMVGVIFYFTAKSETKLLQVNDQQYTSINVVGRQWSWTFNYNYDASIDDGSGGAATTNPSYKDAGTAYDIGTPGQIPTLWLPVNEEVKFTLTSPDVIHSFWIPNFLFKLDVVPGRVNMYEVTPDKVGTYIGECAELCGVEHSRMLFNVKVVSQADYEAHIKSLQAQDQGGTLTTGCGTNTTEVGTDLTTTGHGIRCVVGPMTSVSGKNATGGDAS
ncbi:cytochrome c oxidase subunit II [Actinospica robiniae]|uniref:aa3-type cytochrome oxidase subunit II n=1 Tax=Actinospica robiniae TaxID=304901 RepID=UPI003CCBEB31